MGPLRKVGPLQRPRLGVSSLAIALALAGTTPLLCSSIAHAQVDSRDAQQTPLLARIALSREADLRLFSVRVRRLMAIELYGEVLVEERANGPLDADLIRAWIDVPTPERCLIEVRRNGRSLARRALDITDLPSDIAARIVSIETSEMVRVQAAAGASHKAIKPSNEADDDLAASRYAVEAGLTTSWLPLSEGALVAGPELSLEHRHSLLGQRLFARWMLGEAGDLGPLRWVEVGVGADLRLRLDDGWWMRFGGTGAMVAATLPHATQINGNVSHTDWSATLGALAGVEARSGSALLGASLTASGLLRDIEVRGRESYQSDLGHLSLGLRLSLAAAPRDRVRLAPAE